MSEKMSYYSPEANWKYCSNSQLKRFSDCEACAMAELRGEWTQERTKALDLGSFLDALLVNHHDEENWIEQNRDVVYQKNGKMYAEFIRAGETACLIKKQPLMMEYLTGEHQKMMVGEIDGLPFKIRMDTYVEGKFISDLKYLSSLRSPNLFENVLSYWHYIDQASLYQEIVRQNTGQTLPFYFVIATKETPAHLEVVSVNQYDLDEAMEGIRARIPRIKALKEGLIEPKRCEQYNCSYCTETRVLDKPLPYEMLGRARIFEEEDNAKV